MGQISTFKLQIYTKWVKYQHLANIYTPNGSNINIIYQMGQISTFTKLLYTKWVKYQHLANIYTPNKSNYKYISNRSNINI